jgi:hypothetical protein
MAPPPAALHGELECLLHEAVSFARVTVIAQEYLGNGLLVVSGFVSHVAREHPGPVHAAEAPQCPGKPPPAMERVTGSSFYA